MTDLYAILTGAGLTVAPIGRWQDRKRPGDWRPVGVMVHHTAGTKSLPIIVGGRSDLPGPLANLHIPKDATVNLVSGGRCNHAGPGAQMLLDRVRQDLAPIGDAGTLGYVDGPSGNGYFYGFEAENLGDGRDPWPAPQLDTIARAAAALCRHHHWTAARVVAHREWTRRKPDPRGFAMAALRRTVADLLGSAAPPAITAIDHEPVEVDVQLQPLYRSFTLDDNGRGNIDVPYPIERVVGIISHSEVRPNVDGRYDAVPNSVTATPTAGGTTIVVQNGEPRGIAHVWLQVVA